MRLYVNGELFFIMRPRQRQRENRGRPALPILSLAQRQSCSSRGEERKGNGWKRVWTVDVCERGQTFPWQDPRDPTEGRVQRWRRGCVPGSQLAACIYTTNGAPTVSLTNTQTQTHTHATHECTHSALISTRRRKVVEKQSEGGREREEEWEEEASSLLEWHSTSTNYLAVSRTQTGTQRAQSNKIPTQDYNSCPTDLNISQKETFKTVFDLCGVNRHPLWSLAAQPYFIFFLSIYFWCLLCVAGGLRSLCVGGHSFYLLIV